MNKPVFNLLLDSSSSGQWQNSTVVMEVNLQYLYYVVLDESNLAVLIRYYQFPKKNLPEIIDSLDEICKEDDILNANTKSPVVIYNLPGNCLVPEKFFNPDINRDLLNIMHGDANRGKILSEEIQGFPICNVYSIPSRIYELVMRYFPDSRHRHHHSIWLKSLQQTNDLRHRVCIIFYLNELVAAVFVAGNIQVVQSMKYQAAEDVAYFLLHVCQQFNLKQTETVLQVAGMIDQHSALYEELLKYFLLVETDNLPVNFPVAGTFDPYPQHFFSPLLKLAACVL